MPTSSAYYYYDEVRNTLRHGHTFPDKPGGRGEHWHRAAQPHPDYPSLHDDILAYDPYQVDWSDKNSYLDYTRKTDLLVEARNQHDRAIQERANLAGPTRPAWREAPDWGPIALPKTPTEPDPAPAPEAPASTRLLNCWPRCPAG
jgi:hypothetical protein